jgi:hypothetical protein
MHGSMNIKKRNVLSACINKKANYSSEALLTTHNNCLLFSPYIVNDYNPLVQTNVHFILIFTSPYLACEFLEDGDKPKHVEASSLLFQLMHFTTL